MLKEEKAENNKKIEMIDKKIAKLNFEQKGLKESVDVNWEITDKNQQKQEKTDEQIKVLEEENARVKESVTENNNSQDYTNEDLKILEAKITTLAKTGDQSHGLASKTEDMSNVRCVIRHLLITDS